MKNNFKIAMASIALAMSVMSCEDLQKVTPVPNTTASNLTTNFLFVNASPDAPSLNLYVNNVMNGTAVSTGQAQAGYTTVPITTNNVAANTNLQTAATAGTIGGILGSNNLIFRSGNNNTNNFQAAAGGSYTLIVVDTINRPAPLRTLNTSLPNNPADNTYYSPVSTFTAKQKVNITVDTVINLNIGSNNSEVTATLLKKYNGGNLPATFIKIGIVPLGSSDVGGLRFLVITDNLPLPATTPVFPVPGAGKFSARFINASPDAGSATCKIGAFSLGAATYPLLQGNFNPSVGSRSTTVSFAAAAAIGSYAVTISAGPVVTPLPAQAFADGGIYTVILTGSKAKNTLALTLIKNN